MVHFKTLVQVSGCPFVIRADSVRCEARNLRWPLVHFLSRRMKCLATPPDKQIMLCINQFTRFTFALLSLFTPSVYATTSGTTSSANSGTVSGTVSGRSLGATSGAPTHVIFFGGYGSTAVQMRSWVSTATVIAQSERKNFDFTAAPINSNHSDQANVVADNARSIAAWAKKITAERDQNFLLVGHSSGTAISNAIAAAVNSRSVPLIVLDGFIPQSSLQSNAECWSTVDSSNAQKISLNWMAMRTCRFFREVKVSGCQTKMCLHFSLVNRTAPTLGITPTNYKTAAYEKLVPFLEWL